MESVYSKRIRAGKRRTYFFDIRATRGNDYYLTITESRKKFNEDGYDRHKLFLYKEDFNKFTKALMEAVDYVKTDLMPDFDFDAYNHDNTEEGEARSAEGSAETDGYASGNSILGKDGVTIKDDIMLKDGSEAKDGLPKDGSDSKDGISTPALNPVTSGVPTGKDEEVDKW